MSEAKKEPSFFGGAGGSAGDSSLFSAIGGHSHGGKESSSAVFVDLGQLKARIDELERKFKRMEDASVAGKADAANAPGAYGNMSGETVALLKEKMLVLEKELREGRERERLLVESQEKIACSVRDSAAGIKAAEAKISALESVEMNFSQLSSRLDYLQKNLLREVAERAADFKELGGRLISALKAVEWKVSSLEQFGGKLADTLQTAEKRIDAVSERGEKIEAGFHSLSGRLDSVEKDVMRPLADKLRETQLKVASLISEFPNFLVYENRLTKMELKTEEMCAAGGEYYVAQASLEERMSSMEARAEGAGTELRAAWDMVHMLVSRVDGWDRKLGEVLSDFNSVREEMRRRDEEIAAADDEFRDISSKANNMWGRFTFVEKEFSDIRARFLALDAERRENENTKARLSSVEKEMKAIQERIIEKRETIAQMRSQIHSMNSLIGKFGG